MAITVHEYTAPAHWACYLINGDCSGMEEEDIVACDSWTATLPGSVASCTSEEEEAHPGFLRWHDATDFCPYAADCCLYTVLVPV